jgi:hypothetical protein
MKVQNFIVKEYAPTFPVCSVQGICTSAAGFQSFGHSHCTHAENTETCHRCFAQNPCRGYSSWNVCSACIACRRKDFLDVFPRACTRMSTCFGNAFRIVRQKDSGALDLL